MKGLLYEGFLLNRRWFLASGIIAILGTVSYSLILPNVEKTSDIAEVIGMGYTAVLVIVIGMSGEWLGRHLERNIKCRFTDMTLVGGITKNAFVLAELLKNLISLTIGFAMSMAMTGIISIFDSDFLSPVKVKLLLALTLFIGVGNWLLIPLIIKFRRADKAGIVVGLILCFGVALPVMLVSGSNGEILTHLITLFSKAWFFPAYLGVCAALYTVIYAITLRRVKWGDVC